MIWWGVFVALFALEVIATMRLVPAEHRANYVNCRKDRECWLVITLWHSIWIVAAIQSVIAPGDCHAMVRIAAALLFINGSLMIVAAKRVNPFFLPALVYVPPSMRATGGIYTYLKHPGYCGFIQQAWGLSFLLGQPWALLPALVYAAFIVRRVVAEDRILSQSL